MRSLQHKGLQHRLQYRGPTPWGMPQRQMPLQPLCSLLRRQPLKNWIQATVIILIRYPYHSLEDVVYILVDGYCSRNNYGSMFCNIVPSGIDYYSRPLILYSNLSEITLWHSNLHT